MIIVIQWRLVKEAQKWLRGSWSVSRSYFIVCIYSCHLCHWLFVHFFLLVFFKKQLSRNHWCEYYWKVQFSLIFRYHLPALGVSAYVIYRKASWRDYEINLLYLSVFDVFFINDGAVSTLRGKLSWGLFSNNFIDIVHIYRTDPPQGGKA